MTARVEFAGLQVAYVVGALIHGLKAAEEQRDIDVLGHMLDRAVGALPANSLDAEVQAEIGRIRSEKGLPA